MADDTSETPAETSKPATPRRRAPRKPATTAAKAPAKRTAAASTAKPRAKRAPAASRTTTERTVKAAKDGVDSAKRTTAKARTATTRTARKAVGKVDKATAPIGGKWGAAMIAGGVAAIGAAATAAVLSLRGSTPRQPALPNLNGGAHQPDGTDSSKSFDAQIADENTIPA